MHKICIAVLLASVALPAYAAPYVVVGKPRVTITRYYNFLPPVEFDKPYTGTVWIRTLANEQEIKNLCKGSSKTACAARTKSGEECHIFLLPKKQIISLAFTLRHELGHCNGWPPDHPDKRRVEVTGVAMPKLPSATHTLPPYPSVVCVTPEWQPESCAKRQEGAWAYSRSF